MMCCGGGAVGAWPVCGRVRACVRAWRAGGGVCASMRVCLDEDTLLMGLIGIPGEEGRRRDRCAGLPGVRMCSVSTGTPLT